VLVLKRAAAKRQRPLAILAAEFEITRPYVRAVILAAEFEITRPYVRKRDR
jgi:hypothetical protein